MRDTPPRHLKVLPGGNNGSSRPAPRLVVLDAPMGDAQQQLAFPFAAPRRTTMLSLGVEDLSEVRLAEILRLYNPRIAVDVRLSPSFATWGLTRPVFKSLLAERCIEYRRWPELANRFVGDFLDYRLTLERYGRYLAECDDVRRLHELVVSDGPILLLGRLPEHHESERSVLVDALANIDAGFDLIIL